MELNDGPTRPAKVKRLRDGPKHTHLEIVITEGRNRQVRRMLEAVESKVSKLVRTAIGPSRSAIYRSESGGPSQKRKSYFWEGREGITPSWNTSARL